MWRKFLILGFYGGDIENLRGGEVAVDVAAKEGAGVGGYDRVCVEVGIVEDVGQVYAT